MNFELIPLAHRAPVTGLTPAVPPMQHLMSGAPTPVRQIDQRVLRREEKFRCHSKKGPGRMPFRRSSKPARTGPSLPANWLLRARDAANRLTLKEFLDESGDRTYSYTEYDQRKKLMRDARQLGISVSAHIDNLIEQTTT